MLVCTSESLEMTTGDPIETQGCSKQHCAKPSEGLIYLTERAPRLPTAGRSCSPGGLGAGQPPGARVGCPSLRPSPAFLYLAFCLPWTQGEDEVGICPWPLPHGAELLTWTQWFSLVPSLNSDTPGRVEDEGLRKTKFKGWVPKKTSASIQESKEILKKKSPQEQNDRILENYCAFPYLPEPVAKI